MYAHPRSDIRAWTVTLIGAVAVLASGTTAHARAQPVQIREINAAIRQFQREHPGARVQVNEMTGLAGRIADEGLGHASVRCDGAGPCDRATTVLAEQRRMLLGDRTVEELQVRGVEQHATGSHVRYQQTYRGLPVWGAQVAVHMDARGQVRLVQSSVRPGIEVDTTPALSASDALSAAHGACGFADLRGEARVALGILPARMGVRLAYRVELPTSEPADWSVFVDARDGTILQKVDRLMRVEGEGVVVDQNPLTTPETATRPFVDLIGNGSLKGLFADVGSFDRLDSSGRFFGKRLSRAEDHRLTAALGDPRFDEQMLYYHVSDLTAKAGGIRSPR